MTRGHQVRCDGCRAWCPATDRFCQHCGGEIDAVRLSMPRNTFCVEGMAAVLRFQVTQATDGELAVELRCTLDGAPLRTRGTLVRGENASHCNIGLQPTRAGMNLLELEMRYRLGGEQVVRTCELCLPVLPPRPAQPDVKLDMSGMFSGIQKQLGNDITVNIDSGLLQGEKSYAELLSQPSDDLIELQLERKLQQLPGARVTLEHRSGAWHATDMALRLESPLVNKTYLLLSRPIVMLGRARRDREDPGRINDIVTRVLPVPEHQDENRQIHRFQCEVEIKSDGAYVRGSRYRPGSERSTFLDGGPLPAGSGARILERQTLSLSRVFDLAVQVFGHQAKDQSGVTMTIAANPLFDFVGTGEVAAVRLSRVGNHTREAYVILAKEATVGADESCTIIVPGSGIGSPHCRILRHRGMYWIAGIGDYPVRLLTDSGAHEVHGGRAWPLCLGDRIQLAEDTVLECGPFSQTGIAGS